VCAPMQDGMCVVRKWNFGKDGLLTQTPPPHPLLSSRQRGLGSRPWIVVTMATGDHGAPRLRSSA